MKKHLLILMLTVALMITAVPAFAQAVTVTERSIFLFVNSGQLGIWDRISYNNPDGESITVIIPKDAQQVQAATAKGDVTFSKETLKQTEAGTELTIDIPKGTDLIELNYAVAPSGNIYNFAAPVNIPPQKLDFMSIGNIAVTGPQIGKGSPKKSGNMNLVVFPYTGQLKAGDVIQAQMDIAPTDLAPQTQQQGEQPPAEQPQQQAETTQASPLAQPNNVEFHNPGHIRLWNTSAFKKIDPHLFTALLVLIPVGLLVAYIRQRRKDKSEEADGEEAMFQKLVAKQDELLKKIAELDEKREAGEINEEEYTALRENYKHRLIQIKAQLKKFSE